MSCQVPANDCGADTAAFYLRVNATCTEQVPTAQQSIEGFSVFPNPNNGVFTIEILSAGNRQVPVIITNALGERVREILINTNEQVVLHMSVAPGAYFLSANTGKGIVRKELFVQ